MQTYTGNGDPLPSFDKPPYPFALGETAAETADTIWRGLNEEKRVAVVVRNIGIMYEDIEYCIIH